MAESTRFTAATEETLRSAMKLAKVRDHEYATIEHLLLALTDDADAVDVLEACLADIHRLKAELISYIDHELDNLKLGPADVRSDPKPTAGFQRIVQRSIIHVQASGRSIVNGGNILVALFAERESHAAHFLQEQNITRYDAVNYISHGIKKFRSDVISDVWSGDRNPSVFDLDMGAEEKKTETISPQKPAPKVKVRSERELIIKSVKRRIKSNSRDNIALCKVLSRLAELEIKEMSQFRPNSPESIDFKNSQIQLMTIFFDGFNAISEAMARVNSDRDDKEAIKKATQSVVSLPEALNRWWSNNNQKVIDFAVGSPATIGAFAAIKAFGAGPYVEAIVTGTTASIWFGPGAVKAAVSMAKDIKKT